MQVRLLSGAPFALVAQLVELCFRKASVVGSIPSKSSITGTVAQLVRASDCDSEGCGFDSRLSHHLVSINMVVIRRLIDKHRSYTAIFLPGNEPKIFPTTDYEHNRILQIFKQDKYYDGILNDFSEYEVNNVTL